MVGNNVAHALAAFDSQASISFLCASISSFVGCASVGVRIGFGEIPLTAVFPKPVRLRRQGYVGVDLDRSENPSRRIKPQDFPPNGRPDASRRSRFLMR